MNKGLESDNAFVKMYLFISCKEMAGKDQLVEVCNGSFNLHSCSIHNTDQRSY